MRGIADYVVVYDISITRERSKVDKILKEYGFRVQKSVFECRMSKRLRKELQKRLEKLCLESGCVKIYKLEYSLSESTIGKEEKNTIDDGHAFII